MTIKKQKICIVVPAHWEERMGGSQYQAKMFVEYLIDAGGYDIYYLARHVNHDFKPVGYQIIEIASPSGIRKYGELFDAFKLVKLLKEISPDVIYQRVGCAHTGICTYYAKKYNKKCIWHVAHDREVTPGIGKFSRNWLFRYIDKKMLEYGLYNASKVVTQTQQQAELMSRFYGREKDIALPNVHPWPVGQIVKQNPVKVIWVANLKPWKRPEVFICLAAELSDMKNVEFIMIGNPRANSSWCHSIMNEIKSVSNLRYLGGQSQEVVNEMLSKSHIFVNTSRQEGFANTFIQSWLRKVPVLSLTVNPDGVFDDKQVGICSDNYEELKGNLRSLIKNEDLRNKMGENAQLYAKETYSFENMKRLATLVFDGK